MCSTLIRGDPDIPMPGACKLRDALGGSSYDMFEIAGGRLSGAERETTQKNWCSSHRASKTAQSNLTRWGASLADNLGGGRGAKEHEYFE
jgi:hypothetical protein